MAARDEREHQRPAASVPPEGQRPLTPEPGGTEWDLKTSQRATPKDARLSDPRGYPRARRCADGLNSIHIADRCLGTSWTPKLTRGCRDGSGTLCGRRDRARGSEPERARQGAWHL